MQCMELSLVSFINLSIIKHFIHTLRVSFDSFISIQNFERILLNIYIYIYIIILLHSFQNGKKLDSLIAIQTHHKTNIFFFSFFFFFFVKNKDLLNIIGHFTFVMFLVDTTSISCKVTLSPSSCSTCNR